MTGRGRAGLALGGFIALYVAGSRHVFGLVATQHADMTRTDRSQGEPNTPRTSGRPEAEWFW